MVPTNGSVGLLEKHLRASSGLGLSDSVVFLGDFSLSAQNTLTLNSVSEWHNNHANDPASQNLSVSDFATFNIDRERSAENTLSLNDFVHAALDGYVPPGGGGGDPDLSKYDLTVDQTVVAGQPVYVSGDSTVNLANAGNSSTAQVLGLVSVGASANTTATVLSEGSVNLSDWTAIAGTTNLTPGSLYYLSTTFGHITTTAPSAPTDTVVKIGLAVSTSKIDIEINEVSATGEDDLSKHELIASQPVSVGQPVHVSSSNTISLSDADTLSTAQVLGLVSVSASGGGTATVLSEGIVTLSDWTSIIGTTNLTPGAVYYLSTTAGQMASTPPTGNSDIVVRLGIALTTDTIDIEVNNIVTL
jgi:hypothetical protein